MLNKKKKLGRNPRSDRDLCKKGNTGCPSDIVPPGIRIFDMKGSSKNMNSIHLAQRPMLFLGLRAKKFEKIIRCVIF